MGMNRSMMQVQHKLSRMLPILEHKQAGAQRKYHKPDTGDQQKPQAKPKKDPAPAQASAPGSGAGPEHVGDSQQRCTCATNFGRCSFQQGDDNNALPKSSRTIAKMLSVLLLFRALLSLSVRMMVMQSSDAMFEKDPV